jgi:hypothetical protein
MGWFRRRRKLEPAPVDTSAEPVSTSADQCAPAPAPVGTDQHQDGPVVFGALRSAREHAVALLERLRSAGLDGRSLYQGDIEDLHRSMCDDLVWIPRRWPAIGRELKRLGLRRSKVWIQGQRLTVYEIGEPATSNVIPVERRRA